MSTRIAILVGAVLLLLAFAMGERQGKILADKAALTHAGHDEIVLKGHTDDIVALEFSPDGAVLASAALDGAIRLWDFRLGTSLGVIAVARAPSQAALALAFGQDGKAISAAGWSPAFSCWDIEGNKKIASTALIPPPSWANPAIPFDTVLVSRNLRYVAIGRPNYEICLWDIVNPAKRVIIHHRYTVSRDPVCLPPVAFSPDSRMLASADRNGIINITESLSGQYRLSVGSNLTPITAVAFSPDSKILAAGTRYGNITLWDAHDGKCLAALQGDGKAVLTLIFSPNGKMLISKNQTGAFRVWHVASGTSEGFLETATNKINSVALSPDGSWLAIGGSNHAITLQKAPWAKVEQTVQKAIAAWADDGAAARQRATKSLKGIGVPALAGVESATVSKNPRIAQEAKALLKSIGLHTEQPFVAKTDPVTVDGLEFVIGSDKGNRSAYSFVNSSFTCVCR